MSPKSTNTIKPDFKFFAGKTISFNVGGAPGGSTGNFLETLAPAIASYLHASVKITFVPGANSVEQNIVGGATPDGLTVGADNPLAWITAIYFNSGTPNFAIRKVRWIGSAPETGTLAIACKGAPYASLAGMYKGRASTQEAYIDSFPTSGSLASRLAMAALGIPTKYLTGYAGPSGQVAGCLRGDGSFMISSFGATLSATQTSAIPGTTPVFETLTAPKAMPASFLDGVIPTIAQFAKTHPPKTKREKEALALYESIFNTNFPGQTLWTTPGVPQARVLALSEAMRAVSKTAVVRNALLRYGLQPGYRPGTTILSGIDAAIKEQPQVETFLN